MSAASRLATRDETFLRGIRDAAQVAAEHADEVDRDARFPQEAVAVLRESRALGAWIPESLGGHGVSLAAVAAACYELARGCSSVGMVYAMHQIQVGCLVRHHGEAAVMLDAVRAVASEERLIASATSEVGTGGDLRSSIAAVVPDGDGCGLEKAGPTVSYGDHSDDLLITARRGPDAEPNDQVLVLVPTRDVELVQTGTWDPLGMRGTCSPGFRITARFAGDRVLPVPFAEIAPHTMVPLSHVLWAHVWLGISTEAYERARAFTRTLARRTPGVVPPTATRLSELTVVVNALRMSIEHATREYADLIASPQGFEELSTMGYAIRINNLKIGASEGAAEICRAALAICGMAGFKNDTPFSIGRLLRDSLSAALMIGNDRIHATNAALLTIYKG